MADEAGYRDWRSLELAIKDSARAAVRQPGPGHAAGTVDARIRQARFDRFLCRVFASGEESEWLLKGGMSMLARVPRSRSTKDIDLASGTAADLAEAEQALTALVGVDLGDHLTFRPIRAVPTGMGDNQPGVLTRRLVFACLDADYDTHIDAIMVDIVVGPAPVGRPEIIEPANRLHLKRPLITYPYRLFPVVDQIADKVCATLSTTYGSGKPSTRVKDLVDLVVIAHTQELDLRELRAAITAKQILSSMEAFDRFTIPAEWARTYPATAKGVPSAEPYTAATAALLIARLVDAALVASPADGSWDPQELTWTH